MIKNFHKQGGFSLVELVIYLAILSFLMTVIVSVIITMTKSVRQLHSLKSLENSSALSLERIGRSVRDARAIVAASSTLGSSPGVLVVSGVDASSTAWTTEFSLQNGVLHLKQNGVDQGQLTQSDAKVTSLVFTSITTPHSTVIRTQMTIESGTSTAYRTGNFYLTTVMRGSL